MVNEELSGLANVGRIDKFREIFFVKTTNFGCSEFPKTIESFD